jgi:hypothetical protein
VFYWRFRTVFRVPNGIATLYEYFVRLIFLSSFACARACVRGCVHPIFVCVSSYRALFLYLTIIIRNNPPSFFQNTNTGFLRIVKTIHSGSMNISIIINSDYGGIEAPCLKSNLIFRVLCACEPFILSIPSGILRTERYSNVVRILRPFNFSFWFACVRASFRSACAREVIVVYFDMFRHESVQIRPISFKIQIRDPYNE